MAGRSKDRHVVPPQPGIATEVFRKCLTGPFARAFSVEVETPPRDDGGPCCDSDISFASWEWYLFRPDIEERWRRLIAPGS